MQSVKLAKLLDTQVAKGVLLLLLPVSRSAMWKLWAFQGPQLTCCILFRKGEAVKCRKGGIFFFFPFCGLPRGTAAWCMGTSKSRCLGVPGVMCPGWMKSQEEARTACDWGQRHPGRIKKGSPNACDDYLRLHDYGSMAVTKLSKPSYCVFTWYLLLLGRNIFTSLSLWELCGLQKEGIQLALSNSLSP